MQHVTVGGHRGAWICSCGAVVENALEHQKEANDGPKQQHSRSGE